MSTIKNQKEILEKLKIEKLNPMQEEAYLTIQNFPNVVLLSPTGTGKTLAFLLPVLEMLDPEIEEIQVLIVVPTRELALQIEQVLRNMGTGHKVNAVYGGRSGTKDKEDLKHRPAILIGTPGRVADRLRRDGMNTKFLKTLVLDEFDKSLEIGFEDEMSEIIGSLRFLKNRILTSATQGVEIPEFVKLHNPKYVDYLDEQSSKLTLKKVLSPKKDKAETLIALLSQLGAQPGIVFCNYKETIEYVSGHLKNAGIDHGCFYGGMEQNDRERVLIKFRNGTHQLIIATDLAARGLDIPELQFIIHYQLPHRMEEFTHRNGRTARMKSKGTAYMLQFENDPFPDFIPDVAVEALDQPGSYRAPVWNTLFISGGRKDKISKGDLAGVFMKQGGLTKDEIGMIEVKQDCAFVAVATQKAKSAAKTIDNTRIKKKKVRVSVI